MVLTRAYSQYAGCAYSGKHKASVLCRYTRLAVQFLTLIRYAANVHFALLSEAQCV